MKQKLTLRRITLSGLLLVIIIGLLAIYGNTVNHLPSQIYSESQMEFLTRNYLKSVYQVAPILNAVGADGILETLMLSWKSSRVQAMLEARYEEFEGVSATVYDLEFQGEYELGSPQDTVTEVELFFPFPDNLETLHEVSFLVDGEEPTGVQYSTQGIRWQTQLFPEDEHAISINYRADGANTFTYALPHEQRSDVNIVVAVSGLKGSTVPKISLPATDIEPKENGETLTWHYTNLIADRDIQITLPVQLSFSQRVAQLQDDFRTLASVAPFLVGFCLLSLAGVFHLSGIRHRLEYYLMIGCGLSLFYPLLTFLSGLLEVTLAAALALLLILILLLTFIRLTLEQKGIAWRVGLILIVFLGVFSLGLLTVWRGIMLSGGSFILLGTFMVFYARRPIETEPDIALQAQGSVQETDPAPLSDEAISGKEANVAKSDEVPHSSLFHCPYCSREIEESFQYCPECGRDISHVHRCKKCGHEQFLPPEQESSFCLYCGEPLI